MGGRRHSLSETEDDVGEIFHGVEVYAHHAEVHVRDVEARAPSVFPASHDVAGTSSDLFLFATDLGAKDSHGFAVDDVVEPAESDG